MLVFVKNKLVWLLLIFWGLGKTIKAQEYKFTSTVRLGAVVAIGKPINRVGILAGFYSQYNWLNVNSEIRFHVNLSNYGPHTSSREMQFKTGVIANFGGNIEQQHLPSIYLPATTNRNYGLGYAINIYWDNIKTSQFTGTLLGRIQNISFTVENDAFAPVKPGDSYRTGSFHLFYADSIQMMEIRSVLWTGYTRCTNRKRVTDDESYPAQWGYLDFSNCQYAKFSNGVLGGVYSRLLPYQQVLQIGLGVDDEHIRHFFQNKLIHDLYFVPKKWNKAKNVHIPMISNTGELLIDFKTQQKRKTKPFLLLGVNGSDGY